LNHTTAVTDLSGNPWKCDCSALGEAWRELKHKLKLNCASPEQLRGYTWDVFGILCPDRITSVDTGPALNTAVIVVYGVLLVCTIVGAGFILVQLMKKLRKR
jgi:hypothetical protein